MGDEVVYDKQNKNQRVTITKTVTGAEAEADKKKAEQPGAAKGAPKDYAPKESMPKQSDYPNNMAGYMTAMREWRTKQAEVLVPTKGTAGKQAEAVKSPPPK